MSDFIDPKLHTNPYARNQKRGPELLRAPSTDPASKDPSEFPFLERIRLLQELFSGRQLKIKELIGLKKVGKKSSNPQEIPLQEKNRSKKKEDYFKSLDALQERIEDEYCKSISIPVNPDSLHHELGLNKNTPLHCAVLKKDIEVVKHILGQTTDKKILHHFALKTPKWQRYLHSFTPTKWAF